MKKIPEGQEYAPRLEPTAPIRLADRNHAHYPSRHCTILKKDSSMTDFQHTQSDPHGSHRKMLHVLFTHLPPRCALTFFPAPEGPAVKRLRTPPSKVLKEQRYMIRKEGSQNKLKKIPEGQEYALRLEPTAPIRLGSGEKCQSAPWREVHQEYV